MSEAGARAVRESSALAAAQVVPAALERAERGIAECVGDPESLAALAAVARAVGEREPRWRAEAERVAAAAEAAGGVEAAPVAAPPAAYRDELYGAVEGHLDAGRSELALDLLGDERDVLWGRGDAAGLIALAGRAELLAAREGAPAAELRALADAARHDAERAHWQERRVAAEAPAAPVAPAPAPPASVAPDGEAGTNGLAVTSLVLGILWIVGIGSAIALALGLVARRQIARTGESGRGMATAGIVLGVIGIALIVLLVAVGAATDDPNGSIRGDV